MCGILGIINLNNNTDKNDQEKLLNKLFLESETRGKEAAGFCFANATDINVGKVSQPANFLIKTDEYKKSYTYINSKHSDFSLFFGHARLVTHGYEHFYKNNQPIISNNIILIHNGIVINHKELWNTFSPDIKSETDLDTEIIPVLYRLFLTQYNDSQKAINKLFEIVTGTINIALYDITKKQFILASNNGSLYYYKNSNRIVFASEKRIVKKSLQFTKQVDANSIDLNISKISKEKIVLFDLPGKKSIVLPQINRIDIDSTTKKRHLNTSLEHNNSINVPNEFYKYIEAINNNISQLKRCTKCILPETFPEIQFDEKGVCNICNSHKIKTLLGKHALLDVISKLPKEKPLLVAFSGGRDSSYCLHYLKKELGLNCIAYSYDWGMLTDLGRRNQSLMCAKLNVEHILVSADIRKKRKNIQLNVEAWLKKPSLGMIPLFMAGDKQYFYHAYRLLKELDASILVMGENYLEKTGFKTAFSGAQQSITGNMAYHISSANKLRMVSYYLGQYISNPSYINQSLTDTVVAAKSYYGLPHDYLNLFNYIPWKEEEVDAVLINEYGWETDPETNSTWRIGDGTAAFYNYIYFIACGFTEADTFRSNQIREGMITREKAMVLLEHENQPRWGSIKWYCDVIGIDFENAIKKINALTLY